MRQPEISQRVADFKPLIEPLSAIDAVGNTLSEQRLFQHPRLRIGAIKDRNGAARVTVTEPGFGLLDDIAGFILLVKAGIEGDGLAPLSLCPEIFTEAPRIARYQSVRSLKNSRRRAVVLLEAYRLSTLEVLREALNVFHPRPSPTVDRLVVVTYGDNRYRLSCQYSEPRILNGVGILELIYQNRFEPLLIVLKRLG